MADEIRIFDRRLIRRHRDRAAAAIERHDFLFQEVADRLSERLDEVRRRFLTILDLGARHGALARQLRARDQTAFVVAMETSAALVRRAPGPRLVADEELLPIAPARFDLVTSNLALHWVNDLPGALAQIRAVLKPDGLFLASLMGGETLVELRACLIEAELAERGGAGPRISPVVDMRDAAALLQRAGFALPMVDQDRLTVHYPDMFALMRDLRGMGETSALLERHTAPLTRAILARAAALYAARFTGADGRIRATFQIFYLTGWAPAASQPKPLAPGSAARRLAEALDAEEQPL